MALRKTTKLLRKVDFDALVTMLYKRVVNSPENYDKKTIKRMMQEIKQLKQKRKLTFKESVKSKQEIFQFESKSKASFYSTILENHFNS